jgi:hypothetical protein
MSILLDGNNKMSSVSQKFPQICKIFPPRVKLEM